MNCPFCRNDNDQVIDSRASEDGFVIRRRRECQSFDRDKIKSGIEKACWKRSVSEDQIEAILSVVEKDIYAKFDAEVESVYIGELIMDHLRHLDQVAYVRFASVYREFQDVHDFVDELQPMLKDSRSK